MKAYYFGCVGAKGHCLYDEQYRSVDERAVKIPWRIDLMDTTLLKNGKHPDVIDGKVFWTCTKENWFAFFWWDRSGDSRPNSNSGFYIQGFKFEQKVEAFEAASKRFHLIIERQPFPLVLQP